MSVCGCDCGGHLRNGGPARRRNPGKIGNAMENGPGPKMAKSWPPEWKKWPKIPFCAPFFHFGGHFLASFRAWGHFPFHVPFSREFRAGPVSHSVNGHCDCKSVIILDTSVPFTPKLYFRLCNVFDKDGLALFRSLCNKRQLSRKNKFEKLSGMFPALVFVAF